MCCKYIGLWPVLTDFFQLFSVNLTRSKSTPGLIESSGKIPLHAASITRHHTLPAGLPSQASCEQPENDSQGEENGNAETHATTSSVTFAATLTSSVVNAGGEGTYHSSQETEFRNSAIPTTGSPSVRSPFNAERNTPMFHFSPPTTPAAIPQYPSAYHVGLQQGNLRNVSGPIPNIYSDYISRDLSHDYGSRVPAQQVSPQHFTYNPYAQHMPVSAINAIRSQHPVTLLSPFCASTGHIPSSSPNAPLIGNNSASPNSEFVPQSTSSHVQGLLDQRDSQSPGTLQTGSTVMVYSDASHDSLVSEITRLRERLRQVESENAMMASKLNQQQWELEHRLSELEMHMTCTSDMGSTGSTDDRSNPFENISRESII